MFIPMWSVLIDQKVVKTQILKLFQIKVNVWSYIRSAATFPPPIWCYA